jgi:ureidoglycolate lyase
MRSIKPIDLNKENFQTFGEVIEINGNDFIVINKGYAHKYYNLCNLDCNEKGGMATLHLYEGKQRKFPLKIDMMEKHPHFTQTFMPRSKEPFLVAVALGKEEPDLETLQVFKTNGQQGVHYKKGIWHFPLISLKQDEIFIVIDRNDFGKSENKLEDCIELDIKEPIEIVIE